MFAKLYKKFYIKFNLVKSKQIMTNLLVETLEAIHESGHTVGDIIFIGSEESGYSCSWEKITELANQEYDDSYGAQEVAMDLIIVFSDGQKMWREEYDGSEWWVVQKPFEKPAVSKEIESLFAKSAETRKLADINK